MSLVDDGICSLIDLLEFGIVCREVLQSRSALLPVDVGYINCMVPVFVSALADAVGLRSRLRVSVHLVRFWRDN